MVLFAGFAFVVLCFGFVLLFGAPYLPTLGKQVETALDLTDLEPGQTLLELGCGDGKVLIAAAERGWNVVGYELNPLLVIVCKIRTWRYRQQVRVIWGDFWQKQWPEYDAVFAFALQKFMKKLDTKIMQSAGRPVKLVSFAFTVPDKKPVREQDGVYLYLYR